LFDSLSIFRHFTSEAFILFFVCCCRRQMSQCVFITIVDVSAIIISREQFHELLNAVWEPEARNRILRYHKGCASAADFQPHQHNDTKCFLIGRLLLQLNALANISRGGPSSLWSGDLADLPELGPFTNDELLHCKYRFRKTEEGKPHFDNCSGWTANVSHAGPLVGCSSAHGVLNGLDIMPVELVPVPRHVDPTGASRAFWQSALTRADLEDFFGYFGSYFTDHEWAWIRAGILEHDCFESLKRFFRNWTLKESYIKAIGIGLGLELCRAEFRIPDEIVVCDVQAGGNTTLSLELSDVLFFLDGTLQPQWKFVCFDMPTSNSVAALALGPLNEAVSPLFSLSTLTPQLPHRFMLRLSCDEQIILMALDSPQ
jgi:phosphopantetheinyl transferase